MERGSRNVAVDGIKMVGMGNLGTGEEPLGNQESKDTLLVLYLMFFFLWSWCYQNPFWQGQGARKAF